MDWEDIKLSLFTNDKIIYAKNLKWLTESLLELISNYRKVAGYKVNIQKSITFLYQQWASRIWNKIIIHCSTQTMKYLRKEQTNRTGKIHMLKLWNSKINHSFSFTMRQQRWIRLFLKSSGTVRFEISRSRAPRISSSSSLKRRLLFEK